MAVETKRDTVFLLIRSTSGFVDDVGDFNVDATLFKAKTAVPIAAYKQLRFDGDVEWHLSFLD
jgi:hypothetical protein